MSVFKRGKFYYYEFVLRGERYRGSTKQTAEKAALRFENQIKEQARQGLLTKKSISIEKAFDKFLKVPRKKKPGKQRETDYRGKYRDFVCFMEDKYPKIKNLNQVTEDHAEEYIHLLQKSGRHNKTITYKRGNKTITHKKSPEHLAPDTVNDFIITLRLVFSTLERKANIVNNPFDKIPLLIKNTESREAFTIDELKLIGEKSKNTHLYPLFMTGICTGLRESDICTLRNSEVNLKANWITRKPNKGRNSAAPKTLNIPIMPQLRAYLVTLPRKGEYIFPELAKQYYSNSESIGKDVTAFLEGIGIESTREVPGRSRRVSVRDVHSLRHTFAYMSALANIPLPIVQSILGHKDTKMTQMYMDHASAQAKQKYLAALPDYLNTGQGSAVVTNEYLIEKLENMTADNWQETKEDLISCIKTQVIQ